MLRSRAVDIIRTFSPEELKQFSYFAGSPYHNTNKNLAKMFRVIKAGFGRLETDDFSEEIIFRKTFPGKKYNYNIMKNLMSSLAALCEEFLVINSVKNNPKHRFRSMMLLLEEYDTRLLDRYFDKAINKLRAEADSKLIGSDHYINYALMEETIYFFNSSRSDDKALETAVYNEILYYLCDFYRKFSRSMWKIDISKGNINSNYEKDLIKILYENIDFDNLTFRLQGIDEKAYNFIYLNNLLIKMLKREEDTAPYYELKELVSKTIDQYENPERFSIFTKLLSYCASSYRLGKREFMNESIDIRLFMMEKVRFNFEGHGPFNFHYFIETVLMLIIERGTDIAEEFLKKYFGTLGADKKDTVYNLCMAYILEEKGEGIAAIGYLAKTAHTDIDIKGWIKRLYIRIYYNAGEFEAGLDSVSAFKVFARDKKEINSSARKNYLAFAKIMEKMFKIKCSPEKYSHAEVEAMLNEVETNNYIGRKWQLEKLHELKGIVQ